MNQYVITCPNKGGRSVPYPYLSVPRQIAERNSDTGEVMVIAGDGFVILEEIEVDHSGRQIATNILKSVRARLGMDYQAELIALKNRIQEMEKIIKR
ncbi:hypothetical protein ACFL6I_07465 [candidate division KSB1 bacterium]